MTTTSGTVTYTYDAANRLTSVGGVSYTYDDNGNLTNDGTYTYTWNTAGRLIGVESITTTVVYTYNGDGVRVAQSIDGVETSWVQDQASGLAQVLLEITNGQTTVYLLGLGRLAQVEDGEWKWFLGDALGSVRQVVDGDGAVVLARDYAPFGLVRSENGTGSSGYGFTGEQAALYNKYIYLRARFYDPVTGRFLSTDPFPGYVDHPQTLHRYAYCLNNAINAIDPSGMQGEPWWVRPLGAVGESLKHIADPTRNPRTAAAHAAMWQGVSTTAERLDAWAGISDLYRETIRYTGSAIMGGCWEQALRGGWGVAQQSAVLGASVVVAAGGTVATLAWGLVTTPVRMPIRIIKSGTALGRAGWERLQGKGRGWDVVYTGVSYAGEIGSVLALYYAMAGGPPGTMAAQSADDIPAATVPRERALVPYDPEFAAQQKAGTQLVNDAAYATQRAAELQALLPEGSSGRVTMGAGVATQPSGSRTYLVGTSERGGYLRPGVRQAVSPRETVVGGIGHAEQNILDYASANDLQIITVGAGRPICPTCEQAILNAEGIPVGPMKSGNVYWPFRNVR